jgi:hypothetical protein
LARPPVTRPSTKPNARRGSADSRPQAGKPHSSGTRGYGYASDKVSTVDAEADVITEAARRVLAG